MDLDFTQFKTVIKLKTISGKYYSLPKQMYYILKECKNRVNHNLDAPIIITGSVGSGKSNLEIGLGGTWEEHFHNREMNIDKIHFTAESISNQTDKDDNFTEFVGFDEAIQGGSGRDSISRVGKALRRTLITKRYKRHLFVFCVDSLKELNDKIIERSVVWYHVHYSRKKDGSFRKGIVKCFSPQEALNVYEDLKEKKIYKTEDHYIWKKKKQSYYTSNYMNIWFSEDDYNSKKTIETKSVGESENKFQEQRDKLIVWCLKEGYKQQPLANVIGVSRSTIGDIRAKLTTEGKGL